MRAARLLNSSDCFGYNPGVEKSFRPPSGIMDMSLAPLPPGLSVPRRHFFAECGVGVGKIALASLLTGARLVRRSRCAGGLCPPIPCPQPSRTTPPRRNGSFTCSWRARPANSNCSTTSRPSRV